MIYFNVNNTWHQSGHTWININNTWRVLGNLWISVGNVWRAVYSYSWKAGAWGGCSVSCGGGTQTRSVTCTRNDGWNTGYEPYCTTYVGAKPPTSQACNTHSCISCRYSFSYGPPTTGSFYVCSLGSGKWFNQAMLNNIWVCDNRTGYPSCPTGGACGAYSAGAHMGSHPMLGQLYQICGSF